MNRHKWLRIRDNGGPLTRFLRGLGTRITMPVVRQGEGRNGEKARKRAMAQRYKGQP